MESSRTYRTYRIQGFHTGGTTVSVLLPLKRNLKSLRTAHISQFTYRCGPLFPHCTNSLSLIPAKSATESPETGPTRSCPLLKLSALFRAALSRAARPVLLRVSSVRVLPRRVALILFRASPV